MFPWLSLILFLPLLGSFLALVFWRRPLSSRWATLLVSLADLALVIGLFTFNLKGQAGPTGKWLLAEDFPWIERFGIRYSLGLDGISLMLILLTAFLTVLCVLVSWKQITQRVGAFHFFLMFMETGVLGSSWPRTFFSFIFSGSFSSFPCFS